jgi:hypothetical protein
MRVLITVTALEGDRLELRLSGDGRSEAQVVPFRDLERVDALRLALSPNGQWCWVSGTYSDLDSDPEGMPLEALPARKIHDLFFSRDAVVGPRLRDLVASLPAGELLLVGLELRGTPAQVHSLGLLPWELLELGEDGRGPTLDNDHWQLVRCVTSGGAGELAAADRRGGRALVTLASPLYRREGAPIEAFNAAVIGALLHAQARCGHFSRTELEIHSEDPTFESFSLPAVWARFFLGHGEIDGEQHHLKFFQRGRTGLDAWREQRIDPDQLAASWKGPRVPEAVLGLFACESYRTMNAALARSGPGVPLPALSIATLAQLPLSTLALLLPRALELAYLDSEPVVVLRELRRCVQPRRYRQALAFYHAAADAQDFLAPQTPSFLGRGLVQIEPQESYLGLSAAQRESLVHNAEGLGLERAEVALRRLEGSKERVQFARFRIARHCASRWQVWRVLGEKSGLQEVDIASAEDQVLPALVSIEVAREYCTRMGGRLPTPGEWELVASGRRRTARADAAVVADYTLSMLAGREGLHLLRGKPFRRLPEDCLLPVTWGEDGPDFGFGVRLLGNTTEWAHDGAVGYALGGGVGSPLGLRLPQLRLRAERTTVAAVRVAFSG